MAIRRESALHLERAREERERGKKLSSCLFSYCMQCRTIDHGNVVDAAERSSFFIGWGASGVVLDGVLPAWATWRATGGNGVASPRAAITGMGSPF